EGGDRHQGCRTAALSPRDGIAALDLPAEAEADRGSDRWRGRRWVIAATRPVSASRGRAADVAAIGSRRAGPIRPKSLAAGAAGPWIQFVETLRTDPRGFERRHEPPRRLGSRVGLEPDRE